ncbi:MAG: hypothetical protein R3E01_09615 [Pirellulaceae bacterium]|nr:transferase [Planctomycetales bacterium]
MSQKNLVIFGARAFAEIAKYYFDRSGAYRVCAFCVDGQYLTDVNHCGLPVIAFEELPTTFSAEQCEMFVAVGYHKNNQQRAEKMAAAKAAGYQLARYVSPKAQVADDLTVGENSMVMEHATVQPFVTVGDGSIIWSASRVGFHTQIGNYCWIVSAIFGESVVLGDRTFVGLNATVAPNLTIGQANVIGAGALVLRDSADHAVFRGVESVASKVPSYRLWTM